MGSLGLGFESTDAGVKEISEGDLVLSQDIGHSFSLCSALNCLSSCVHLLVLFDVDPFPALGELLIGGDESLISRLHIY